MKTKGFLLVSLVLLAFMAYAQARENADNFKKQASKLPILRCGKCIPGGTADNYKNYSLDCMKSNGGDADLDGVPDDCDNCKPGNPDCHGVGAMPPCWNPNQEYSSKNGIGDICETDIKECVMYEKAKDKDGNWIIITNKVPHVKCGNNDTDCDDRADWYFDSLYKHLKPACDACPPPPAIPPYNSTTYPPDFNYECNSPEENAGCPADQPCCNPNFEKICKKIKNPCGDTDTDGDGIANNCDNCPFVWNPPQTDDNKDGVGDECVDFDGDNVTDANDNCPFVANSNQQDSDGDGAGNACDTFNIPNKGSGSKTCLNYGMLNETCWKVCPSISGDIDKYYSFKLSGIDSDFDGIDDACDQDNLPAKHSYWQKWKQYLQEKGFDTSAM